MRGFFMKLMPVSLLLLSKSAALRFWLCKRKGIFMKLELISYMGNQSYLMLLLGQRGEYKVLALG